MANKIVFPFPDRHFSNSAINANEPILFHYTSAAGALGIMQSGEMWCSLASHMNDKQECKFAHGIARRIAFAELSKADLAFRTTFISEFAEQLERYENLNIYVSCFSEAEDLLSQWRGYTGKFGYAFGFSLNSLKIIAERQSFKLVEVKYNNDEHERILRPIVQGLIAGYNPGWDRETNRPDIDKAFQAGMQQIAEKSAIIKHPTFSEEREWRLHSDPFALLHDGTDFVVRDGQIVPIVKLSLDNGTIATSSNPHFTKDICIRSCVVGPGPDQEERSSAIWAVALRYKTKIGQTIRSASPLR
ncbi:hypothetical protein ACVWWG_007216 [Bradyrhizobium sp. LB7.2]